MYNEISKLFFQLSTLRFYVYYLYIIAINIPAERKKKKKEKLKIHLVCLHKNKENLLQQNKKKTDTCQ